MKPKAETETTCRPMCTSNQRYLYTNHHEKDMPNYTYKNVKM